MWILFALIASVLGAAGVEANRIFKIDGLTLNFWKQVAMLVLVLPVLPFIQWPTEHLFWLTAALVSIVIVVGQTICLNLAAQNKSRIVALLAPVQMLAAFFLWGIVKPESLQPIIQNPVILLCIFGIFSLFFISLYFLRKNDVGWRAFLLIAPVAMLYAVADVLSKKVLIDLPPYYLIPAYIFACGVFAIPLLFGLMLLKKRALKHVFTRKIAKSGMIIGVIDTAKVGFFLWALIYTSNPAYVTALMLLMVVWIMLWHKVRGMKDDASPLAGLVMVLAAILLVLVTR